MDFDSKKIIPRYSLIFIFIVAWGLYILGNAAYLMFVEKEYWEEVSKQLVQDDVPIPANRGNILSADGHIMASSLPEYKIYMDFVARDKDPKVQQVAGMERLYADHQNGFYL